MINLKLNVTLFSIPVICPLSSRSFHIYVVMNLVKIKGFKIYWNVYIDLKCDIISIHFIFLLKCLHVLMCFLCNPCLLEDGRTRHHTVHLNAWKWAVPYQSIPYILVVMAHSPLLRGWYSINKGHCFAWAGNTFLIRTFFSLISCWDE